MCVNCYIICCWPKPEETDLFEVDLECTASVCVCVCVCVKRYNFAAGQKSWRWIPHQMRPQQFNLHTEEHNLSSKIRMSYTHIFKKGQKFKFPTPKQQKKTRQKIEKKTPKNTPNYYPFLIKGTNHMKESKVEPDQILKVVHAIGPINNWREGFLVFWVEINIINHN